MSGVERSRRAGPQPRPSSVRAVGRQQGANALRAGDYPAASGVTGGPGRWNELPVVSINQGMQLLPRRARLPQCRAIHSRTVVALGIAVALAGCSASDAAPAKAHATATTLPAAATATPLAPSASSSSATAELCRSTAADPCRGSLKAGTYTTAKWDPGLTFTVPDGWSYIVEPGNLVLVPPGGSPAHVDEGGTDDIFLVTSVVPPTPCIGQPSPTVPWTVDGIIGQLKSDEHFAVSNVKPVSLAGLEGTSFEIVRGGNGADTCENPNADPYFMYLGNDPSEGEFGVGPNNIEGYSFSGSPIRTYLLKHGYRVLAVQLDDAFGGSRYGDGKAFRDAADAVIQSFRFTGVD